MLKGEEPLACGSYASSLLLGGTGTGSLSSSAPMSAASPNLMDADVPSLTPTVYVGVNEDLDASAVDRQGLSVISVGLLTKLKERHALRTKNIEMVAGEEMEVEEDDEDDEMPAEAPVPSALPFVNPSLEAIASDEVDRRQRCDATMQSRLAEMQRYREERSGSSAVVLVPPATAPTQEEPQNGADMARRALTDTLTGSVLLATPTNGSNPYIVPRHRKDTDMDVTYKFIEVAEAVRLNLMEEPTLTSDVSMVGLPLARAPDRAPEPRQSNRSRKRPMRYDDGDDDDGGGSLVVGEVEVRETYEERLAKELELTLPATVAIPTERKVEYPDHMIRRNGDSAETKAQKNAMRKRYREEVAEHNTTVQYQKDLRKMKEQTIQMQFFTDWMEFKRKNGRPPPVEMVVYYVIYQPFLKDFLTGPPFFYKFDDAYIERLVSDADLVKAPLIERMDEENSIKSILASAMIKMNEIESRDQNDTDNDILEALRDIIQRYTLGQEELLKMMDSSSGYYRRGVMQSKEAKQTKEGLDSGPQIEVLKRLKETLAQGSAGSSQSGADTHVIKVFDIGIGVKNPHIAKCNDLYEKYNSPTVAAAEKRQIKEEYDQQYALYKSKEEDTMKEQNLLKLTVAEMSAKTKTAQKRAAELQVQLDTQLDEMDGLKADIDEDDQNEEGVGQLKYEIAAVLDERYNWERTPPAVKMQIFPPDGKPTDGDTSAQKNQRHKVLEGLLKAPEDRKKRLAELVTETLALQVQISQIKYAEYEAKGAKDVAASKLRYARETRVQLTDEQREKRNEAAAKRRKEKGEEKRAAGGDAVEIALAAWQRNTDKSRDRVDKDVAEAKSLVQNLKSAKVAFEREKEGKRERRDELNAADVKKRSELMQKVIEEKKALGRSAKAALMQKVWDAASQNAPLNQKNKERQDAMKEMEEEVSRAKGEFHACVEVAKRDGMKRKELRPLYDSIIQKTEEYKRIFAANGNQRSQASDDLKTQIKEVVPEAQSVEQFVAEYKSLDASVLSLAKKCIALKGQLDQKKKAKDAKEVEFAAFIGHALDQIFKESRGSESLPITAPTDEDKREAMKVVELIVEQQDIQIKIDKRNSDYQKDYDANYAVRKSTEKLKDSASASARAYAGLYIKLRQARERIESNLKLVVMKEEVDYTYVEDAVSVFEGDKKTSLETNLKSSITRARNATTSSHERYMNENLALRLARSNRLTPREIKPKAGQAEEAIDQDLQDAVSGRAITTRSETAMRMAEYQDAIDDIVRFAKAGSGRALHFYSMVCWYAVNFSRLQEGGDKSQLLAAFSGDIGDCKEPSDAHSLTIYWENVEKYKPPEGWRDLGSELIYIVVQWTRIPMERRAGSVPSQEQLQKWLDERVISSGADSSQPEIDPLTGELMVVTSEDRQYNKLRGILWDAASGTYKTPATFGDDQRSEPLGPIKRTPVSWVALNRGRTLNVHVPINDEFHIVRRSPFSPYRSMWPLHLTHQEALKEYLAEDDGPSSGKDTRAIAAFTASQKWKRSPQDNGNNYPEFDPSDFTAAFWDAVETSRDNHVRLVDDYKTWTDEITKFKQKMQELQTTAENAVGSGVSTKTVSSLAKEAGVVVDDSVKTADVADSSLLNMSTMQSTTGAVLETYRTLKVLELAKARLEYRMAADFGIPRTGYTRFDENRRQLFQSMLDYRTKYESFVDASSVLDRAKAPRPGTEKDGVNASAERRMWLDNKEQVKQAVVLFNQFLKKYYPWETALAVDDEVRLLQFLDWMRRLRMHNFTHVVLLMKTDTNMRMWVCGVDGGGASQRVLGPDFTTHINGFSKSNSEARRNQSRWFTYASDWDANTADRVDKFESSVVDKTYDDQEEARDTNLATRLRAMIAEMSTGKSAVSIVESGEQRMIDEASSSSSSYQTDSTSRSQQANLLLLNAKSLPSPEDQLRKKAFDATTEMASNQQNLLNTTMGSNPFITITLQADGAVAPMQLTRRLFDIEPRHMRLAIKALKHKYPGMYSTCMRYVSVNGSGQEVGTIVKNSLQPPTDVRTGSMYALSAQSKYVGTKEFEDWLSAEVERAQGLQALAAPSRGAPSSYAPPLPLPPGFPSDSDADMLPLPAPSTANDGAGPSQPDATSAEEAEQQRRAYESMWEEAMREAEQEPAVPQPVRVLSDSDDSDDSDAEPANADPPQSMDTTAAIEDERQAVEEADLYVTAMINTPIPELDSDTMNTILRMYDPGPLRCPTSYCGAPIRPMPLPDFEVEVA